jgi:hypothetical protein
VGVDILSGVDVPAIDSQMLTLKSNGDGVWGGERQVLLRKDDDTERRISSAAAMIPREPDKEGETVSTPTVEQAAHDYLKGLQDNDGTGVDTDHNLIDDKGHVVESRILREDREYDLPDGGTKTHKAGTWLVDIEWAADPWERVKAGDIEGISIYGTAEQVPIERSTGETTAVTKPTEFTDDVPDDISTMSECITWADSETDIDDPGAFCQANNLDKTAKGFEVPFADETVVHVVYESQTAAEKASEDMGLGGAMHEHEFDGMTVYMPGETHDEFVNAYNDAAEMPDVGSEVVQSDDTEKEDPCWEGYEMIGTKEDEFGNEVPNCVPKSAAKRLQEQGSGEE